MKKIFLKLIPFELKRGSSWISIIIALIFAGLITELGKLILLGVIDLIGIGYNLFGERVTEILTQTYEINLLTIILGAFVFIIFLFPIYRRVDKLTLKKINKEIIFEEDFTNPVTWSLNHWGSNNPTKTNRIENNKMVFEATNAELQDPNHFFGANYDIVNGIYDGNTYEVLCQVSATRNATMKFQLWLHDTTGGTSSVKEPDQPKTPSISGEEFKIAYQANQTNRMRIHLHCMGGEGRIEVEKVTVTKIK